MSGLTLSAEERAELRGGCTNAVVTMSDGTVYYPPGGGMMSNGDSSTDFTYQMQLLRTVDDLQALVARDADKIRAVLDARHGEKRELRAQYQIAFPDGFAIEIVDVASDARIFFDGNGEVFAVRSSENGPRRPMTSGH